MAESETAADVYERVYDAAWPELFFKSAAWRVVGHRETVAVRSDSEIDVPEPELLGRLTPLVGPCDLWRNADRDAHAVFADPKFDDPAADDFDLADDSPAFDPPVNFEPIGVAGIGPR